MYSIAFPEMVKGTRTFLYRDHEATLSNLKLILSTVTRNVLFGDPYYGTDLLEAIYYQNNIVLWDLIQDEIYVAIKEYIPQIELKREDIKVYGEGTSLYATIKGIDRTDHTNNLYNIKLTDLDEI